MKVNQTTRWLSRNQSSARLNKSCLSLKMTIKPCIEKCNDTKAKAILSGHFMKHLDMMLYQNKLDLLLIYIIKSV